MSFVVKGKSNIFLKAEVTEGVYVAPTVAADAVEVLEDFAGFEYTRESIERSVLSDTIEAEAPRAGLPSVTGALPTEFKAAAAEGAAPRANLLYKSLFGGRRQQTTVVTSDTGHTTTVINLDDADASKFNIGDCVLIKQAGAHHVSPVSAVNNTPGSVAITLLIPSASAPSDAVVVSKLTTYYHANNEESLSVSAELGGDILEKALGSKVESAEISNWTTGQIPQISFNLKSLSLQKEVSALAITPDFSAEPQPPVALDAKAYIGGVAVEYNEFSLTMANTLVDLLSAADPAGKIASRNTNFLVTGTINPYMDSAGVDNFDAFNDQEAKSFFIYVANPSGVAGEIENVAAIYLPQVVFTSVTNGDQDGVLTDEIEFQAYKAAGGDTIYMSFI
jgi:hypothetical protein